jgi:Trk K+ transport system NAD-binding subunit
MKITIVGRDNIGGGLARMRTQAGHDVTTLAATPIVPAQGAPFDAPERPLTEAADRG